MRTVKTLEVPPVGSRYAGAVIQQYRQNKKTGTIELLIDGHWVPYLKPGDTVLCHDQLGHILAIHDDGTATVRGDAFVWCGSLSELKPSRTPYQPKPWREPTLEDVEPIVRLLVEYQDDSETLAEICLHWLKDWPQPVKSAIWSALNPTLRQKIKLVTQKKK